MREKFTSDLKSAMKAGEKRRVVVDVLGSASASAHATYHTRRSACAPLLLAALDRPPSICGVLQDGALRCTVQL